MNVVRKATLGEIRFRGSRRDGRTSASIAARQNKEPSVMADDPTDPTPAPVPRHRHRQTPEQIRAAALAETARIAAVRKVCGGKHSSIEAQAIRDGWDATPHRARGAPRQPPQGPVCPRPDNSVTSEVLEGRVLPDRQARRHREGLLEQAIGRRRQAVPGRAGPAGNSSSRPRSPTATRAARSATAAACSRPRSAAGIEAGMTTIDVGGILSNVANKFLLEGFFSVERVWRNICASATSTTSRPSPATASSARTSTSRSPGRRDQARHARRGDLHNKADTYGLMLSIDRRDIINDDLGAITTVPRKLGRGSGLKINDVFWTAFMNNAAFFAPATRTSSRRGHRPAGIDGLTKGEQAFMDLVDSDGKPTGVMPSILLVPTALSAMGTQLYKSVELRTPPRTPSSPSPTRTRASSASRSAATWPTRSTPATRPRRGTSSRTPTTCRSSRWRSSTAGSPDHRDLDADFNMLGIRMRGYHDFGVNLQDPRRRRRARARCKPCPGRVSDRPLGLGEELPATWRRASISNRASTPMAHQQMEVQAWLPDQQSSFRKAARSTTPRRADVLVGAVVVQADLIGVTQARSRRASLARSPSPASSTSQRRSARAAPSPRARSRTGTRPPKRHQERGRRREQKLIGKAVKATVDADTIVRVRLQ